jgi:DNA polymerase-1
MAKLYLVDSFSLIFRAFYAMQRGRPLTTPAGEPSGAVFGFATILSSLLEREKPDYIACVFDTKEPTHRHVMYEAYKANRQAMPEELVPQVARIKELIDVLGIKRIEQAGFEADDIIGTLSREGERKNIEVFCVTSDKDYYQLVDSKVRLLKPASGSGDYEIHGEEECKQKFGVMPTQVIDVLALIGDTSDNIPGVKGVGEKTAIPLVQQYGSLENVYAHLEEIPKESLRVKLRDNRAMAELSKTLVTIDCAVPLDHGYEECLPVAPDPARVVEFFDTMGFATLKKRWLAKLTPQGEQPDSAAQAAGSAAQMSSTAQTSTTMHTSAASAPEQPALLPHSSPYSTLADISHEYITVSSKADLEAMIMDLQSHPAVAIDLETTSLDAMQCEIVGISACAESGKAYYIPVFPSHADDRDVSGSNASAGSGHVREAGMFDDDPDAQSPARPVPDGCMETRFVLNAMRELLETSAVAKWGQNIKYDALILKRHGIDVQPISFDSMIASYVLNPDASHGMDAMAQRLLNYQPISITTLIGEKKSSQISMRDVPVEQVAEYAAEDADVTYRLCTQLQNDLQAEPRLDEVARSIEFPLISVLRDMEYNGIAVDSAQLGTLGEYVGKEVRALREKILEEAGVPFNPDSPKQLGEVLFEKMGLPVIKKNKTGYSTDVQVLSELAPSFPIAEMMLEYRQLQKLQSTYIESLPRMINSRTGRIHSTFAQHIAATGRLSSTDPNLQNIPIKTELGRKIRAAFVPVGSNLIFSADYSQIELRIMASVCKDETLTHAFQQGLDIHTATAAKLFDVPLESVDSSMRRKAKTVNFGIMYGQGAFGLARQLGISRTEGKEIIDQYFRQYERIKNYMESTIRTCEERGYVETLCGRRRYLPDIRSANANIKAAAERTAVNTPIQGSAADMIKIAMIRLHKEMARRNLRSLMMLQVHDELVFEVVPEELDEIKTLVKDTMEQALPLGDVPVLVETGVGKNWDEAH